MLLAAFDWNIFDSSTITVIASSVCLAVLVLTVPVMSQWRQHRIAEAEARLKLQMIERGFSAAEIERVVNAHLDPGGVGDLPSGPQGELADERS